VKGASKYSGFLSMVMAILAVVLYTTLFGTVMTALTTLSLNASVSSFTAFSTVIGITPTVLFLIGVFGSAWLYKKGYASVSAGTSDPGGLLRMVFGILLVILFITLFGSVVTAVGTLYTSYGSNATWVAFGTVMSISVTVMYLGGIFAGVATARGGWKARKHRKALR